MELMRPMAAQLDLVLQTACQHDGEPLVTADRQRLRQILLNLCSNAVKYNHHGGTMTLACQPAGDDRVRITVSDTGPGIPADKLSRLFTPFDRLGAEKTGVQGTGLGLALSKLLVEALGSSLCAYSVQGQGTTFAVEFAATTSPLRHNQRPEPARLPTDDGTLQGIPS